MKTYLITGGAGFIGSNFVRYILKKYVNDVFVINLDSLTYAGNLENLKDVENFENYKFYKADICNKKQLERIFKDYSIDYVVNFAAETHVDRSIMDPSIFVRSNVEGTLNLLNAARNSWEMSGAEDRYKAGCKFLQISTDEVYGSLGKSGFFTEETPLSPNSPYSASKASADLLVRAYFKTYKMPVNITRCSNNYGEYQFPEKLIPLTIKKLLAHEKVPIYGDGLNVRDWLYVKDHCSAVDMVLHEGKIGEVYNVGGNNEMSNINIVELIINHVKNTVDSRVSKQLIEFVNDRKGHDRRYAINSSKINKDLGWSPCTAFSEGIVKTINWYLSNEDWLRNIENGSYRNYYSTGSAR